MLSVGCILCVKCILVCVCVFVLNKLFGKQKSFSFRSWLLTDAMDDFVLMQSWTIIYLPFKWKHYVINIPWFMCNHSQKFYFLFSFLSIFLQRPLASSFTRFLRTYEILYAPEIHIQENGFDIIILFFSLSLSFRCCSDEVLWGALDSVTILRFRFTKSRKWRWTANAWFLLSKYWNIKLVLKER